MQDKQTDATEVQVAEEDGAEEDHKKTARQRAKEAADKKAKLAAEAAVTSGLAGGKKISKAQRDREADAKRGLPPPAKRNFRAPAALLPDIITTWELLHVS